MSKPPSKSEFSRMLDTELEVAEATSLLNEQIMMARLGSGDLTLERSATPASEKGAIHPRVVSVFPRGTSPVQNFRFRNSTVSDEVFASQERADAGRNGNPSHLYESDKRAYLEETEEEHRRRRAHCPSGDFRYFSSARPQERGDHSDTADNRNPAGTSFSSAQALFPPPSNPDPSPRNNNGAPIRLGVANGERGVAERECTPPPSSVGLFVEEETRGAKGERDMSANSWVVPDRFHQGRESLSVKRNVTKRESRRPKARLSAAIFHVPFNIEAIAQTTIPSSSPGGSSRLGLIWDPHCLLLDFLHLVSFYVSQIWCSTLGDPK